MITRDLVAPAQANLGRALDASAMSTMRVGSAVGGRRTPRSPTTLSPGTPTIDLSGIGRRVRLIVLIAVAGVFLSCVLGILAFVIPAVVGFNGDENVFTTEDSGVSVTDEPRQPPGASVSLHTAAGWTALVDAIKAESGTTEVYELVVYPDYASVGLDGNDAIERRLFRAGDWQKGFSARTPVHGALVELAEIEPEVIAGLPGETARHFGIDEPTGAYLIVNAFTGDPQISVYVQSNGESRYRTYRLDGTAKS